MLRNGAFANGVFGVTPITLYVVPMVWGSHDG